MFLLCLCIHVAVWRNRYPKNRPAALLFIFIVLPVIAASMLAALSRFAVFMPFDVGTWGIPLIEFTGAYLLHFSLSAAYIMSYPAVEAVSPSLMLALIIGGSNERGVSIEELISTFDGKFLLEPRIKDLKDAGMVSESKGLLSLTRRGKSFVTPFIVLRRALGLPIGGG
ncbi:MAG: hypothetical protein HY884_05475 [Deltaproteobacteria bacterium]|nr:hypothetical protein [Deltaproteobacteria bacterium]